MSTTSQSHIVNIHVSGRLYIRNLPEEIKLKLKKKLTLSNPLYYKLKRSGNTRAMFATPQSFKYYSDNGSEIIVPRGILEMIKKVLDKRGVEYSVSFDTIRRSTKLIFNKSLKLRDYQHKIVEDVVKKNEGIINASTGSGKSIMMLEIAYRLGMTCTILVPNTLLLRQLQSEAKKFFGIDVGIIGDGKKDIKDITISTFQSLFSNGWLLKELVNHTSILMIDECHGVVSDERMKVVKQFKPDRIYGFSATLEREDGKAEAIKFLLGSVIAEYAMTLLNPTIEIKYSGIEIPSQDYHDMVKIMTTNKSRNNLILGLSLGEIINGRKVLILTKRVAHAELIDKKLPDSELKFLISSNDKGRHDTLKLLKSGLVDFNCVIGTTSLLSQGFDLPKLDTLVLACDMRSGILTKQSVGRVLRLFDGKKQPKIIDIVDSKNPFFNNQANSRKRIYRKCGWEIDNQYDF
jgi:superfamily II DNA or RNA helicase